MKYYLIIFQLNFQESWTAPVIVDKALEYIPELENEIEQLTLKNNMLSSAVENISSLVNKKNSSTTDFGVESLTVSVNEVKKGQSMILQICRQRDGKNVFSSFLQHIEEEGTCLVSASTLHVCDERECYHIHIEVRFSSFMVPHFTVLLMLILWIHFFMFKPTFYTIFFNAFVGDAINDFAYIIIAIYFGLYLNMIVA